jgi:DNA-binding SARP family transcriptional activator
MGINAKITYRQQYTRCGKDRCRKCKEGSGHGPYWYAYWSENGRTISKYIGAKLPEVVAMEQLHTRDTSKSGKPAGAEPHQSTPVLKIYLLGQFRIERKQDNQWRTIGGRSWHRHRARALLGCLLNNPSRRLGREQIMDLLWPDLDINIAANRLNGAVHELRQILEPDLDRPANSQLLRLERDMLELADNSQIWVDAETFENLLKEADISTDPLHTKKLLEEAAALYQGNYLLEELYSEWSAQRRDTLQRAWVGLLLTLSHIQAEHGEFVSAIEMLDRLRSVDPSNETALQRLMLLLTQRDRRGEALHMYRRHKEMLAKEYESEPLPETQELYEKLRQGHIPTQSIRQPEAVPSPSTNLNTMVTEHTEVQPEHTQKATLSFIRPLFQPGRHNRSPLIGREQERQTLRQIMFNLEETSLHEHPDRLSQALHSTSTSHSQNIHFVLLRGESGIGKTRLAEELSLEAYQRNWTVAWSRSYEQESLIPYHPWAEILRTFFQNTSTFTTLVRDDNQTTLLTESQSNNHVQTIPLRIERLCALLPDLAHAMKDQQMQSISTVLHAQERLHLWETTLGLIDAVSQLHPLLLVLDDLHWADDSSIELLTYLLHHFQEQHVLIVGICCDGELAPQHKLHALIADLQREQAITIVAVQPLTHAQIGALVSHLPQASAKNIQVQAAGNPFFAEELARYINTPDAQIESVSTLSDLQYDVLRTTGSLPDAVAAVLERRLSRLSSRCLALLRKVAVIGGSFELRQLLPITSEHDEDTVLDLLEEALQAGLLIEEGTGAHIVYHFWHPLIISHLYSRLTAARRAQLHRKVAESLTLSTTQPEKIAATIVYHLSKGGGDPSTIAHYAEIAGNKESSTNTD